MQQSHVSGDAASLEDLQAVRRCQAGEKDAFRYVVERYGGMLFAMAYQSTRNHALAQELTQDTLTLAWRGIVTFRGGSLKAWLCRILANRSASLRRRRAVDAAPLDDPEAPLPVADETQDPAAAALASIEHARIRAALAALPEDQRQVVEMRFLAELSVGETAAALGVREGTVKSRLSRALERLRAQLGDDASP